MLGRSLALVEGVLGCVREWVFSFGVGELEADLEGNGDKFFGDRMIPGIGEDIYRRGLLVH